LDDILFDRNAEVLIRNKDNEPTPLLKGTFSAESIKARTDAIALLGIYAKRLGELSSSEAPRQLEANTRILGDNLYNLQKTFELLNHDATAKNYTGPVGAIVGVIGNIYLEQQRDAAIKKAIEEGAPSVRKILSLLQTDLVTVIEPLRETGFKQRLADRVTYYNDHRKTSSFEQRKQLLAEINVAASRYDAAVTANPANLIQSMTEAHESLVKYAGSPKTPQNLAELQTALEIFRIRAQETNNAIKQIRDLRKGA
jgi:hypothetical protein